MTLEKAESPRKFQLEKLKRQTHGLWKIKCQRSSLNTLSFLEYAQADFLRISSEGISSVAPACSFSGFTTAANNIPIFVKEAAEVNQCKERASGNLADTEQEKLSKWYFNVQGLDCFGPSYVPHLKEMVLNVCKKWTSLIACPKTNGTKRKYC